MAIQLRSTLVASLAFASLGVASARADDFLSQEGDMWRASKLVGVNVYGPDKKKVGDINEVLMGKDGKAAYVVVGVGGFLGIGEKNVAIPFDKVSFTQDPMNPPAMSGAATTGAAAPVNNNMAANTGMGPAAGVGAGTPTQGDTGATGTAPAGGMATANGTAGMAAPARSTAYPDHGTVTYTVDQLKAAPTFAYAK